MSHKTEVKSQRRFKTQMKHISSWPKILTVWPYHFLSTIQSDRWSDPIIIVISIH